MAHAASTDAWHTLDYETVLSKLEVGPDGLSSDAAADRLAAYGPNSLPVVGITSWWRILIRQFVSPLIAILFIAGIVTSIQQHWIDAGAIFIVLIINAALGFWQERKAERDVHALQSLSTTSARVMRDGEFVVLPAEELVPGDVVSLESGDRVPADTRLIDINGLRINESMLTGESLAATKGTQPADADAPIGDRGCIAFSGTFVTSGRGSGVVARTGIDTELGAINELIQGAVDHTPLQILTHRLERRIGVVVLVAVAFVFVAGLIGGFSMEEMFRTAVALAVGAIPESLPIILTVAMSVGVSRMAKHNAIVRTLPAVETLGSTTVIASDKTGTLTQNKLTVERFWTTRGFRSPSDTADRLTQSVLRAGSLTNESTRNTDGDLTGDAVDVAMLSVALKAGAITNAEWESPAQAHTPYEPSLRYSQTVRRDADGRQRLYVKGSPDIVAHMSDRLAVAGGTQPMDAELVLAANHEMAAEGLRVIATAERELAAEAVTMPLPAPAGLTFLGMEGMTDPPRAGVGNAIRACHEAGISVKMVTGDHPTTAEAIARRLGMDSSGKPLTGADMADLDDADLAARLEQTSVAARVAPKDKLRIVQVLQEHDHVVAVTGDGVNDAPALKAASIGVAMGASGTDVAREAADVVLTDDNFVTIVDAVEQGRVTFAAIRKATFFLLSTAVAIVLALSVNVLLDQPLLFLPVQILWINLVASGLQDIALAFEPAEGDELSRPPRRADEGVLSSTLWWRTMVTGIWMGAIVLLLFGWALERGYSVEHARSLALATFVLFNFFQLGNARGEYKSLFVINPLRNRLLLVTGIGAIIMLWAAMSWPATANILGLTSLSTSDWATAGLIAVSVAVIVELEKAIRWLVSRYQRQRSRELLGDVLTQP